MPFTLMGREPSGNAREINYVTRTDKSDVRLQIREYDEQGHTTGRYQLIDVREQDLICWIGQVLTELAVTREDW